MNTIDIIAQGFGIIGLCIIVYSFQCRKNSGFFLMQGVGSLMFFINFLLIGKKDDVKNLYLYRFVCD